MNWTQIRTPFGNRSAIIGAGVAGFVIGAGGLVAAQIDDSPSLVPDAEAAVEAEAAVGVESTVTDTVADTVSNSSVSPTSVDLTVPVITVADSPDDTAPDTTTGNSVDDSPSTIDDSSSSSVPDSTVDSSSSVPDDTAPDTTIDDSSSSSVPDSTVDSSSSVPDDTAPAALPAPFSRVYQSAGGSIDVTWTGSELVLAAVSPAGGFTAEIEEQRWDRIRVDFEGEHGDARIEVELGDDVAGGQIRVRID